MTGYEIYCQWCEAHGQVPPTKEWWDKACAQVQFHNRIYDEIRADQAEIDRERRDGWSYGE